MERRNRLVPNDRVVFIFTVPLTPVKFQDVAPGVIYLGRIPHGFYEEQMKEYFSQFGEITRLRLSRNKKTGRSKHFAFLEFKNAEVAKIVADTMDNYLLFGHLLKCKPGLLFRFVALLVTNS